LSFAEQEWADLFATHRRYSGVAPAQRRRSSTFRASGRKEDEMATGKAPRVTRPRATRRATDPGSGEAAYPLRQRTFESLLGQVDEALRRSGITPERRTAPRSTGAARPVEVAPADDEQDPEQRAQVRTIVGVMCSQLERRLLVLSRAFAGLSQEQRDGVAALLRLPARRRGAIATLLRLPAAERTELSVGFRLSDIECRALAQLLDPSTAAAARKATVTIVDTAVAVEDETPYGEL
jgi:hypothetical protein